MGDNGDSRKKVVIAGGGISGLSAAFYLKKMLAEANMPADIALVEKSGTLGGKIRTLHRDGFVIEQGPDSFLARKLPILELTRELGLEGELTGTNPDAKKTYILHKGRLHRMPPGLVLGIPTEITPFLKTGLVSPLGKARAALDFVIPRRRGTGDESLGGFLERRLGREVVEHIAEPLLAGIYAGDAHQLSLKATFPQFHAVEQKYGSLIRGMIAGRKQKPEAPGPGADTMPAVAKNSLFLTYKKGLTTLVTKLEEAIRDVGIIRDEVKEVRPENGAYALMLESGGKLAADAVILALPAFALQPVLVRLPEATWLGSMEYVSVANIVLAYDRREIAHPLDGSGFVVPRKEGRYITACTWTSSKWLHTAPSGKALLRCYVGRSGEQEWAGHTDEEMLRRVRRDLRELMGITAEPLFAEVTRLHRSMPQYPVGHPERIRSLRERLAADWPGVFATGAAFEGVGIPDCIRQGKDAAKLAVSHLLKS